MTKTWKWPDSYRREKSNWLKEKKKKEDNKPIEELGSIKWKLESKSSYLLNRWRKEGMGTL